MATHENTHPQLVVHPDANAPGVLVTFEGGDGAGKSTHIRFLAGLLESLGFDVVCIREPGGTSLGEQLRAILLDPDNNHLSDRAELLIYEASRAQLMQDVIAPALARGAIVLCDRYIDSTLAYQGYGRGLDIAFIQEANAFATGGVMPDATIVLTCASRAEKQSRVDRRDEADRLELAGDDFHARVIDSFLSMAAHSDGRMTVVETDGMHSQTARAIFKALERTMPWLSDGSLDLAETLAVYDAAHDHSRKRADEDGRATDESGRVHG